MKLDFQLKKELKEFLKQKLKEELETAYVYVPYRLSEKEIKEVEKALPFLQGKKVKVIQDKDLIAGFKVKVGTRVFDFTVESNLNSLLQK